MAVIATATFDGATSGEATTATTGAALASGAAAGRVHSTTQKINGSSVYFSGTAASTLQWGINDITQMFARFYLRRETTFTNVNNCSIAAIEDYQGGLLLRLGFVSATGDLMVRDGTTIAATYPTTLGQWYRVDWSVQEGIGQRVRLYTEATIHSANTADAVAGGTLLPVTTTLLLRRFQLGEVFPVSPACNFYVDELALDNTTLPAPYAPPAVGRRLERKVAGAWVPQVVEKKVAGTWVPQIVERKDAGVWS